ncbi:MAG: tetratricopeptide repeat protein [Planctomycetota bacterium]
MRRRPRNLDPIAVVVPFVLAALAAGGCGEDFSNLVRDHVSKDRKADAQKQWDAMRGSVKLQLAENQLSSGRLEEARKTLEQAIAMSPDSSRAHLLLARLELERGELAKAREAIDIASSLPGNDPEVEYVAGIVAERYDDLSKALGHYTYAAIAEPHCPSYVLARAETLVALGRHVEALEVINERIADFDGNLPMRMLAARLNRMLDLRGPTVTWCQEALRLSQDDPLATAELGRLLVWAGEYEEAIGVLRPLVESATSGGRTMASTVCLDDGGVVTPSVLRALARAYVATRQWQQAKLVTKPLMARDKQDVASWCLFARAALESDDMDGAWEALRVVHSHSRPTAETKLLAAHVALCRGDNEAALAAANEASEIDASFVTTYCIMGQAREALGEPDRAREAYAKAVELDPMSPVAQSLLYELARNMTRQEATEGEDGDEEAGVEAHRGRTIESATVLVNQRVVECRNSGTQHR